jgi:hypothetical protein
MINTGERSRLTLALDHFIAKASAKVPHSARRQTMRKFDLRCFDEDRYHSSNRLKA